MLHPSTPPSLLDKAAHVTQQLGQVIQVVDEVVRMLGYIKEFTTTLHKPDSSPSLRRMGEQMAPAQETRDLLTRVQGVLSGDEEALAPEDIEILRKGFAVSYSHARELFETAKTGLETLAGTIGEPQKVQGVIDYFNIGHMSQQVDLSDLWELVVPKAEGPSKLEDILGEMTELERTVQTCKA